MSEARFIKTQPLAGLADEAWSDLMAHRLPLKWGQPGPVVEVLGAPGSGKTGVLTSYHGRLVRQGGLRPEEILVISATRDSATVLRDRLLLALAKGHEDGFAVEGALARTVSSLAYQIVRSYNLGIGLQQPQLISGAQQDAIIEALLTGQSAAGAGLWPQHITEVTRGLSGFRAELRDLISTCQEHAIDSSDLAGLDPSRAEWLAAADIFAQYESQLSSAEFLLRFDAPSLLNRAIQLVEGGHWQPKYQVILVDDAQELTPAAVRLLSALTSNGSGLILFGDPDSTTLGFRQAGPRLMSQLVTRVGRVRTAAEPKFSATRLWLNPDVETAQQGQQDSQAPSCHGRAMGRIAALIPAEGAGAQRRRWLQSPVESRVQVFRDSQQEIDWLAYNLRRLHLEDKLAWSDLAVVARTRQQLDGLERALAAHSVPVQIVGAQHALKEEHASRELLELASFCVQGEAATAQVAERLFRSPFCGLDSVGIRRLRRQLRRQELAADLPAEGARNSDELLVELIENPGAAATLRGSDAPRIRKFVKSIAAARALAAQPGANIEELLWLLWSASGLAQTWAVLARGRSAVSTQANRDLDAVVALFAAANRFVERNPGKDLVEFLLEQLEQKLPEDSLSLSRRNDQFVSLLTPAGLVGRSFEVVAIPQLIEGIWPNLKPRNSLLNAGLLEDMISGRLSSDGASIRTEMADELRMFYKAMGSARRQILISSYVSEDEQVSQFVGLASGAGIPSEETFELPALTLRGVTGFSRRRLVKESDPDKRLALAADLARLAAAGVAGAHPDEWYGLRDLSSNEALFQFVEGADSTEDTGARITLNPSQLEAFLKCPLHWFLNYHGGSSADFSASIGTLIHGALELAKSPDEAALWRQVESGWHTLKFESDWIEQAERRRAQHAVANLARYLGEFEASGGSVLASEREFELDLGPAHIRGKVDRIEMAADGRVMIVDLKTGSRIPSVAEAEANPQLGLYQLAFQHGSFSEVVPAGDVQLAGAKLLLVATDNPTIRPQPSIAEDPQLQKAFEGLVADAATGMAMPDRIFLAKVSSHCSNQNEYGSCAMQLRKAVSYVG